MKPPISGPILIVGGGPAGLGAASELHRLGFDDWLLFEADDAPGGLSRSFVDDRGCTWDIGGHIVFSHYDRYTRVLDGLFGADGWLEHQRETYVRLCREWIPYPLQNNLHRLPPAERARCVEGLFQARRGPAPPDENFDDYVVRTFGPGIAELFMRPYNFKVWAHPLTAIGTDWLADRVAAPDLDRIARNLELNRDDVGWGPNNAFRVPRAGGTGAIWRALAASLPATKVRYGAEVVGVDVGRKIVTLANGETHGYERLIATAPLDRLAGWTGRRAWIDAAAKLVHTSTHVVGVGLTGAVAPERRTTCWMYFPEDDAPFYRVTHFSFYSPQNVPDIRTGWSLMGEVSESPAKPVDGARLVDDVVRGLHAVGLIESPAQVTHTWSRRVEYGYPIPTPDAGRVGGELLRELMKCDIWSRGRFGAWRYEVGNMDHCFMQGVEAAGHLLVGSPELTVWHPAAVNAPHPRERAGQR
jgi:protoporphyrinogen oxidase